MREETTLVGIRHNAVKDRCSSAAHPASAALFGVKVVVTGDAGNNLAVLGHAKAF